MATTAEHLADPELLATEWDLSPLVDGDAAAGFDRLLDEATAGANAFASSYAGTIAQLDAGELAIAMHELEAINELIGRAASYASLRFATDTADPARGALLQRMQERITAVETQLLFFELEWAAVPDQRAEELLAGPWVGFLPPPPAQRATLSPASAVRARGEDPRGEGDRKRERMGQAVRRAGRRAARQHRRRGAHARHGAQPPAGPRARRASGGGRGGFGDARAGPAHARVHLQHAGARQVRRGPPALLSPLARRSQPVQRGVRRVGDGADRGGPPSLRHPAALVSAQGQAAGSRASV